MYHILSMPMLELGAIHEIQCECSAMECCVLQIWGFRLGITNPFGSLWSVNEFYSIMSYLKLYGFCDPIILSNIKQGILASEISTLSELLSYFY